MLFYVQHLMNESPHHSSFTVPWEILALFLDKCESVMFKVIFLPQHFREPAWVCSVQLTVFHNTSFKAMWILLWKMCWRSIGQEQAPNRWEWVLPCITSASWRQGLCRASEHAGVLSSLFHTITQSTDIIYNF